VQRFWDHHLDALHDELTRRPEENPYMIEIVDELNAIHRRVAAGADTIGVLLRRSYPATPEEVWDAVADPERLRRWFLPVTGELKVGGSFQLEGNAGGEILSCDAPTLLRVTWGDPSSIVELRLAAAGADKTDLELEHTVPKALAGSGAGALYVGPGWDLAVLALGRFLTGGEPIEESGPEGVELGRASVEAWTAAIEESGTATAEEIAAGREMSLAQFAPEN
jgi:uncharacterized protein YndB with AHSA1/START domain